MTNPLRSLARRIGRLPPPLILAVLYAGLIAAGACALMLPLSRAGEVGWSDAVFTAASAVTVTGLGVIDTGHDLTLFGQAVLLVLIQLGGLGLMTFAVLILGALGLPVGVTGNLYLREDLRQSSMGQLKALVRTIIKVVFVCELAGAMLLAVTFVPRSGWAQGTWDAVFHSVSAFNNAGFSTFSDGLVPFATDPVINAVIPGLFITGGIGYAVMLDIRTRRDWRTWSLHTKLMLAGTAVIIPLSVGMFAALEWTNPATLGQHDTVAARLMVSWFQGVTTRTAGFNTTDIAALREPTALMFIGLMLIGGGPTSTAGGIKVTTFIVMVLATVAFFRRRAQMHVFGRSIGMEQVFKVMALIAVSLATVQLGVFFLTLSIGDRFLDTAFEVASALGNVGLTRSYTDDLTGFGRAVIVLIMFLGRVGPLTLGFFLATRESSRVRYPPGEVHLG
jgi:trk system potassium uptake protein TrkH